MDSLLNELGKLPTYEGIYKPSLFDLSKDGDAERMRALLATGEVKFVSDDFEEAQRELFGINNPSQVYTPDFEQKFKAYFADLAKDTPHRQQGIWVFYPWLSTIVHTLPEADFQKVRSARNRNLISHEEQEKFYDATIGIGGLSVGSSVVSALILQGGGKHIKLADFDRLALTNTNRIRSGIENLGCRKVEIAARQIYEVNPYAEVELFADGITRENIDSFFKGLTIVVDELDNLAVKYLIREYAAKYKIPVVMGADNGDNAVIDVERYDQNPGMPFFHGRLGEVSYESLSNLDKFGIGKTITKHIGPENVTERMQQSLLEMGKTIVSWPQLGGAALVNGAAIAYVIRKIVNGQPVESNRALISLDEKLIPEYMSEPEVKKRDEISSGFKKMFGL